MIAQEFLLMFHTPNETEQTDNNNYHRKGDENEIGNQV